MSSGEGARPQGADGDMGCVEASSSWVAYYIDDRCTVGAVDVSRDGLCCSWRTCMTC